MMVAATTELRTSYRGQFPPGETEPEVVEKWASAVRMRVSGLGYAVIARSLGYADASGARKAVQEGLRASLQAAGSEELRGIEAERLDRMHLSVWSKAVGGVDKDKNPIEPNPEFLPVLLKIAERRARLFGLDAPVKLQHSGDPDQPVVVKVVKVASMDEI